MKLPFLRRKHFNHLMHLDRLDAREVGEGWEISGTGWVMVGDKQAATQVHVSFGTVSRPATLFYRPDVIPVPEGNPSRSQLAGFSFSLSTDEPKGEFSIFAHNSQGGSGRIWHKKIDTRQFPRDPNHPLNRLSTFDFVKELPALDAPPGRSGLQRGGLIIDWVIPDFGAGAGGHVAIFKAIAALEAEGNCCRIWINYNSRHGAPGDVQRIIAEAFCPLRAEVRFLSPANVQLINGDAGFATDRWTAYYLRAAPVAHRFYLVQDFEPAFYPAGASSLMAENTYRLGFHHIASSPWLVEKMAAYTGEPTVCFNYGVDHTLYHPEGRTAGPEAHRIAFYSRTATDRRAVEVGMLALEMLASRRQDFEVHLFGEKLGKLPLPFPYRDHGVLTAEGLATLYRDCSIGLVLSATNHAIIPKEMMACGLPVIELDGANTRSVYPQQTIVFSPPDPEHMGNAIAKLLDDHGHWRQQQNAGLDFARSFHWKPEIAKIVEAVYHKIGL